MYNRMNPDMVNEQNELSILVYSCYRNRDMWRYFSASVAKYWPDRIYRIVLVTDKYEESKDWSFDDVIQNDSDWSDMIANAVKETRSPFVMLFMDDYLLTERVDGRDIAHGIAVARSTDAMCVRLLGEDDGKLVGRYDGDDNLSYYPLKSPYCLSTHPCIWNSQYLYDYIHGKGWSAWDFERIGSMEYDDLNHPVVIIREYRFPYIEAVRNGKWLYVGVKWCKKNGIPIDYDSRPRFSIAGWCIIDFKGLLLRLFPNTIVKIQNRLSQAGKR